MLFAALDHLLLIFIITKNNEYKQVNITVSMMGRHTPEQPQHPLTGQPLEKVLSVSWLTRDQCRDQRHTLPKCVQDRNREVEGPTAPDDSMETG